MPPRQRQQARASNNNQAANATSASTSPSGPSGPSSAGTSPSGTPVPTDLSKMEKNIDALVNDYRKEIATKREQAIKKLQEEKMQRSNKDNICAGIFKNNFREMLDIQHEAVVKGNPPTGEDKKKLVARCEALLLNVGNFEKGPKDRNNATIELSTQFNAFLVWFKKAVNELKDKINNGSVVVAQSIIDESNKAQEASTSAASTTASTSGSITTSNSTADSTINSPTSGGSQ